MNKVIFRIILLHSMLFFSCCTNSTKYEFHDIDFKLIGYEWDWSGYKLRSDIVESIAKTKGNESAAAQFTNIGDMENCYKYWDKEYNEIYSPSKNQIDRFSKLLRKDAIPYVITTAVKHQIAIINEAHHVPQHRIFTAQLLDGLKKEGYTHLGLESLFTKPQTDSTLNTNLYPVLKSGSYIKEPQFGNLVRLALKKGFKVFGYESVGGSGKSREIDQAQNIKSYMDNNPDSKYLIHCGYDHGYEGELSNSWEKAMAQRLHEITGKDPLTINQVIYSERSEKKFENPFYQLTDLNIPSVFLTSDGTSFGEYKHGGHFDIAVFHTRRKQEHRPNWMIYDKREVIDFSFNNAEIDCPCLVMAYVKDEPIGEAIPYDIVQAEMKNVKLVLDKDEYDIVIWDTKNSAIKTSVDNR